jgi:hypothetical protein
MDSAIPPLSQNTHQKWLILNQRYLDFRNFDSDDFFLNLGEIVRGMHIYNWFGKIIPYVLHKLDGNVMYQHLQSVNQRPPDVDCCK